MRSWFDRPLITGAVTPSGKALAKAMAAPVDLDAAGPVVELGPGTGPMTAALLKRGIAPERLVLVEYSHEFADMLRLRFPGVQVVRGDAYAAREVLRDRLAEPASAIVSSLPLLTKPAPRRAALLNDCFDLAAPNAPFIQFTYGVVPPVPTKEFSFVADGGRRVWWNLPPARVWVYRRPAKP
ncbi:methyltransferase [Agaricicola taiwanensis]|uniref:Methyltransferase n=1 Tax=Agaricicola taiwanensis TaxID=591372 RepID=A0A8J2VLD8_9RHOB|nr:methyltransferase [Agaricicola taiwanensis]GGE29714.1 methyltransferase [Agaricicola taiwanensis]